MSSEVLLDIGHGDDEAMRAQKLAAARRKLKTFRATRSSVASSSQSSASSPHPPSTSSSAAIPLIADTTCNSSVQRSPTRPNAGELDQPPLRTSPQRLRKPPSKCSIGGHRRQASSVSGNHASARGNIMSLFDPDDGMNGMMDRPKDIATTPATPLLDTLTISSLPHNPVEDRAAVKAKLSTFSFGAKPPSNTPIRHSPRRSFHQQLPLLPSQLLAHNGRSSSPNSSPSKRFSTPLSRPPSLFLTRPTPLAFSTPTTNTTASQSALGSPETPPTPARSKRHSHTRSNSISLPNLKLASRPQSLGVPSSPSYPSSPSSPVGPTGGTMLGTRLKFEPSGRGAEAEKEREEYRRKALEKLTGTSSPVPSDDSPGNEITLPELDDEDGSSVASSNSRPFSGVGSFSFGRPSSLSSTPSGFSWSTNEDSPPMDRWSGFGSHSDLKEEGLGFGVTFGGGGFNLPQPPITTNLDFGLGLPTAAPVAKRPNMARNLSVLAEVEEPEEGEVELENEEVMMTRSPEQTTEALATTTESEDEREDETVTHIPILAPTSSRLRELHLVSSVSSTPSSVPRSSVNSMAHSPSASPTKGYGTIGRGRPRPVSGISSNSFKMESPTLASTSHTPKHAGTNNRKKMGSDPRSRGSSISYKKDNESSSSSRDLSGASGGSSQTPLSPPTTFGEMSSPSPVFRSPKFPSWGPVPRAGISRPCPRPKNLAGLGIESRGSGRVLGEVDEVDEEDELPTSAVSTADMPTLGNSAFGGVGFRFPHTSKDEGLSSGRETSSGRESSEASRDSFPASYAWRDPHLELEMERDALKEDVDLWRLRCQRLEEILEAERKEVGVLRDRVRKLGDRLSSMSTTYPQGDRAANDRAMLADMRSQLFGVTAQLEQERADKTAAHARITKLENALGATSVSFRPTLKPLSIGQHDFSSTSSPAIPATPRSATPESHRSSIPAIAPTQPIPPVPTNEDASVADPNLLRIKEWGFPRGTSQLSNQPRSRESFFGLSKVPIRNSSEDERPNTGVDLPPFLLTPDSAPLVARRDETAHHTHTSTLSPTSRKSTSKSPREETHLIRSSSITSSASSALSFLSGYLPVRTSPQRSSTGYKSASSAGGGDGYGGYGAQHGFVETGELDLRKGCKCCVGEVMEL